MPGLVSRRDSSNSSFELNNLELLPIPGSSGALLGLGHGVGGVTALRLPAAAATAYPPPPGQRVESFLILALQHLIFKLCCRLSQVSKRPEREKEGDGWGFVLV